jgi:hypothetical protein
MPGDSTATLDADRPLKYHRDQKERHDMRKTTRLRPAVLTILISVLVLAGCSNDTTPEISGFSPSSGTVGTTVTITGDYFSPTPAKNTVTFNGAAALVASATSTEIVTTVPSGATTGPIYVKVGNETGKSATDFAVLPAITGFSPASGTVGTTVTITGTGFGTAADNTIVAFNGTSAAIGGTTSTQLVVTVPTGATTGQIAVTVNGLTASSPSAFTVN